MRVGLNADGLKAQSEHPRTPAGGDEQLLAAQLASVIDLDDVVLTVASHGARARRQDELDALTAQNLAERLSQRRGLPPEHVLGHVDHRHLAAEPAHGLRHLHPDRAATEDQQTTGNGLHRDHLAVAPDAVELAQARYGRHDRIGVPVGSPVLSCSSEQMSRLSRAARGRPGSARE